MSRLIDQVSNSQHQRKVSPGVQSIGDTEPSPERKKEKERVCVLVSTCFMHMRSCQANVKVTRNSGLS